MNLSEKTAGKHIPFYLTFRNPFRFFLGFSGWKNVLTFFHIRLRSRPTSASWVVPFITFPVIRTTRVWVWVGFWWQFLGAQKCLFRREMYVFFVVNRDPTKKTKLEGEWIFKKDGALESTKYSFWMCLFGVWQKPFRAERTWKILRRCQAPIYRKWSTSLSKCSYWQICTFFCVKHLDSFFFLRSKSETKKKSSPATGW